MDNFISWFFEFMDQLFGGIWAMIKGFFLGLFQTVNVAGYWSVFKKHAASFGVLQWILAIVVVLLIIALFAAIVYMIVLLIKKWVRYRKTLIGNEDLLRELSDLHRDVARLTAEKEKIMELKLANGTLTLDAVNEIVDSVRKEYNDAEAEDAALREQQLALSNAEKEEEKKKRRQWPRARDIGFSAFRPWTKNTYSTNSRSIVTDSTFGCCAPISEISPVPRWGFSTNPRPSA
ncbi:MAG: hypothetical protein ACLR06_12390 [Christensenellaceae bacterium]